MRKKATEGPGEKSQHGTDLHRSPQTWRAFQREMRWWLSALDLEGTKWLLRQSGVVRQRGEEFLPEELEYQKEEKGVDPETGNEVTLVML